MPFGCRRRGAPARWCELARPVGRDGVHGVAGGAGGAAVPGSAPAPTSRSGSAGRRAAPMRRWTIWSGSSSTPWCCAPTLSGDPTFRELLARVRETEPGRARRTRTCRSSGWWRSCNPDRSIARHPLFQVMLALQNTPEGPTSTCPACGSAPRTSSSAPPGSTSGVNVLERHARRDGAAAGVDGAGRVRHGPVRPGHRRERCWPGGRGCWARSLADASHPPSAGYVLDPAEARADADAWNDTARAGARLPPCPSCSRRRPPATRPPWRRGGCRSTYAELDAAANRLARC